MIFIIMNLNEQIHRIKNLMYEQPQFKVVENGEFSDTAGKSLELFTPENKLMGKLFLASLENAPLLDSEFQTYYDEGKFQTIPLNYENSLFGHGFEIYPEFRGNGYGEYLLDYCHDFIRNNGYDYLTFIMDYNNPVAQNLYKKRGYKILGASDLSKFYFAKM